MVNKRICGYKTGDTIYDGNMSDPESRQSIAEQAAQNLACRARDFEAASKGVKQEGLLDKEKFVALLLANFDRIDADSSQGISRQEILDAFANIGSYSADESIMLLLLLQYFDFICDLVDDDAENEKVISRADVETLSAFLMHSDMSLESLRAWCEAQKNS